MSPVQTTEFRIATEGWEFDQIARTTVQQAAETSFHIRRFGLALGLKPTESPGGGRP